AALDAAPPALLAALDAAPPALLAALDAAPPALLAALDAAPPASTGSALATPALLKLQVSRIAVRNTTRTRELCEVLVVFKVTFFRVP
ncbi:MAG: hypothetical protein DWQ13_08555, partial [Crenarchaeota archaeon]